MESSAAFVAPYISWPGRATSPSMEEILITTVAPIDFAATAISNGAIAFILNISAAFSVLISEAGITS